MAMKGAYWKLTLRASRPSSSCPKRVLASQRLGASREDERGTIPIFWRRRPTRERRLHSRKFVGTHWETLQVLLDALLYEWLSPARPQRRPAPQLGARILPHL